MAFLSRVDPRLARSFGSVIAGAPFSTALLTFSLGARTGKDQLRRGIGRGCALRAPAAPRGRPPGKRSGDHRSGRRDRLGLPTPGHIVCPRCAYMQLDPDFDAAA
ncbi:MAG: hypothetical protein PVF51_06220 [Nitrospirota bacterium]|jgi:hypothetical protein